MGLTFFSALSRFVRKKGKMTSKINFGEKISAVAGRKFIPSFGSVADWVG